MGPRLAWSNILSEITIQDDMVTTHIKRINSQLGILNQTLSYSSCMSEFFDAVSSEDTEEEIDDGESEEDRSDMKKLSMRSKLPVTPFLLQSQVPECSDKFTGRRHELPFLLTEMEGSTCGIFSLQKHWKDLNKISCKIPDKIRTLVTG